MAAGWFSSRYGWEGGFGFGGVAVRVGLGVTRALYI